MRDEPDEPGSSGFIDEFGFVEGGGDEPAVEARPLRLAVLVGIICVVALVLAVVLLNGGGGSGQPTDVGLPSLTTVPTPTLIVSATPPTSATHDPHPTAHPRTSTHHRSTSAAPSTSATPTPTTTPSSTTAVPPPPPVTATVVRGPQDFRCGDDCHFVVVGLTNAGGGHVVHCLSAGGQLTGGDPFGAVPHQYVTTMRFSFNCSFNGPGTVWVVVDGRVQSNRVTW